MDVSFDSEVQPETSRRQGSNVIWGCSKGPCKEGTIGNALS